MSNEVNLGTEARFFVLGFFLATATAILTVRTSFAIDRANEAHERIDAITNRIAQAEAFVAFARPLWYGGMEGGAE